LRAIRARMPGAKRCAQIVIKDRRLAHGIDPGLGARCIGQMCAISGGKHHRIAGAQAGIDGDEPLVGVEPGFGQPGIGARARSAGDEIGLDLAAITQFDRFGGDPGDLDPLNQGHAQTDHRLTDPRGGARAETRQYARAVDQCHLTRAAPAAQGVGHGHHQFGPGDAATDYRHPRRARARKIGGPAGSEGPQRLGRDRMIGKTLHLGHGRGDADIDRGHVKADRWAARHMDLALVEVDTLNRAQHHPRAREARQLHQVDIQRRAVIVTGDETRQHARIGRGGTGIDHRHPCARQRHHPPFAQHQRMGVAAPDQNKVAGAGQGRCVHDVSWPYALVCRRRVRPRGWPICRPRRSAAGTRAFHAGECAIWQ